jgi:hypothetical protein
MQQTSKECRCDSNDTTQVQPRCQPTVFATKRHCIIRPRSGPRFERPGMMKKPDESQDQTQNGLRNLAQTRLTPYCCHPPSSALWAAWQNLPACQPWWQGSTALPSALPAGQQQLAKVGGKRPCKSHDTRAAQLLGQVPG